MQSKLIMERIRYIFTHMKDAVCLCTMNGELIYANPAADTLFSLHMDRSALIWKEIPFVAENDGLIQLFIDGILQKKKAVSSMVTYVNNEGRKYDLHVTLTCESAESGMILIVVNDLTDLVRVHSAFERYTSPEIADYVLTTPGGEKQGGQSREATILMSDLRGFTAMSTRLPSDQLITMLNHYFAEMSAVITQHRGTVIEFLGDGIFVVFGAPQELPDHAEAAVRCAVEMQNALSRVNEWNREQGYPELEMGIGINSGSVVVGNIGSEQKMKYGCMGETVNLAGRLESFTLGGEVCISENTRKRIAAELKILGENSFMPKGGQEKMKYYSISGLGADCALQNAAGAIKWRTLPAAKEIDYSLILAGKAVDEEPHKGLLTEVSEDEKHGMLQSDRMLQPLQNLLLRLNGLEAYAKVTECGKRGCRISFTSKQDGFSELLR